MNLFEAIKKHANQELVQILNSNPNLEQKYDLSPDEIDYMHKKLDKPDVLIINYCVTRGLTPLFMAVLYENNVAFELLVERGANPRARTMGNVHLVGFLIAFNRSDDKLKQLDILKKRCPELLTEPVNIPMNLDSLFSGLPFSASSSRPAPRSPGFFETEKNYKLLETLVVCANKGDLVGVTRCIKENTHQKDVDGSSLYKALCFAHQECAVALVAAGVEVKNKHYFAAGIVPQQSQSKTKEQAIALYQKIKPSAQRKTAMDYPKMILDGDLDALKSYIEANNVNDSTKADYLYKLLSSGHTSCVRYLLTQNSSLEPRHYFAAGQGYKEETAIKIYKLLSFYKMEAPKFNSLNAHEVLGVHENASDFVIKAVYKKLALQYHTDRTGTDDAGNIQKINNAKSTMMDNESRDRSREQAIEQLFPSMESNFSFRF